MAPKFFYFDLGQVLLNFSVERMACQMGLVAAIPAEAVKAVLFGGDLQQRYEAGEISSEQFYEEFCLLTRSRAEPGALAEAARDIFEINLPMLPVVGQLAGRGYRMGILSNTCECHWEYCWSRYGFLRHLFRVAALSYELRAVKPHRTIYEEAARLAGCRPEEILFVDDKRANVEGARLAGFDAIEYRSARQVADELRGRGVLLDL